MIENQKEIILSFLHKEKLAIISTVSNEKPESAVLAFGETENLELIFGTSNTTRKYKNLKSNSNVAFVIGFDPDLYINVQYEGVARELISDEVRKYVDILTVKNPRSAKFAALEGERYFLVTPTWIRYTDEEKSFEVSF
jgi:uncharacterized protein YhbP (UPF0306 family)